MPAPMLGPLGSRIRAGSRGGPVGPPALRFMKPTREQALYTIKGITRDSAGAVLGNCVVDLFYATGDKQRYSSTTSDADGAYTFMSGDNVSTFFVVSYKDGGTPVGGTTLQTLRFT